MRAKPLLLTLGLLALFAVVSLVATVSGFFAGLNYAFTRQAQADAVVTKLHLSLIRAGQIDDATRMLEMTLQSDFVTHWAGLPFEESMPRVWMLQPLPLTGLSEAAAYLAEHPNPSRDEFVQSIVACYLQPGLPDPRDEMVAHRKAIRDCYDKLR